MNEKRVALIGIIVENYTSAEGINAILHEYGSYIIGRMGIPYPARSISIRSVAVDAPCDVISSLAGKLGMLDGVMISLVRVVIVGMLFGSVASVIYSIAGACAADV